MQDAQTCLVECLLNRVHTSHNEVPSTCTNNTGQEACKHLNGLLQSLQS